MPRRGGRAPILSFLRFVVAEAVRGPAVGPDDPLAVWLGSGNWDAEAFARTGDLDVQRRPTQRPAFGFAIRLCIGTRLPSVAFNVPMEMGAGVGRRVQAGLVEYIRVITAGRAIRPLGRPVLDRAMPDR
jgi:hypothetical protein